MSLLKYFKSSEHKATDHKDSIPSKRPSTDNDRVALSRQYEKRKHELSKMHVKCVERKLDKSKPMNEKEAAKCLYNLNKQSKPALKFCNVNASAKSYLSLKMYTTLCKLDQKKGIGHWHKLFK